MPLYSVGYTFVTASENKARRRVCQPAANAEEALHTVSITLSVWVRDHLVSMSAIPVDV